MGALNRDKFGIKGADLVERDESLHEFKDEMNQGRQGGRPKVVHR